MIPTPKQLFVLFERGAIGRDELHALLAVHARDLIEEMEEDRLNPAAAWIERLLTRRSASRLVRRHGSRLVREILVALAEIPGFPPARFLWNAAHPDVPLHCFFRIRREPVFRILIIENKGEVVEVSIECGAAARGKATRSSFRLRRGRDWRLNAEVSS